MDSDATDEEKFHEAVKRLSEYEMNRSLSCSPYPYIRKDSASSDSSSKSSKNESSVEKSLLWDSHEIKLFSQRSENLEFGLESSNENDESVVKPNYSKNPDSYRQVCVPDEELDNSPVLNWTRVR